MRQLKIDCKEIISFAEIGASCIKESMRSDVIKELSCGYCRHKWWPKSPIVPLKCPKCKNPHAGRRKSRQFMKVSK